MPGLKNLVKHHLCTHGLSDRCVMSVKTVTTDYQTGVVSSSYLYWCPEHNTYGRFVAKTDMGKERIV